MGAKSGGEKLRSWEWPARIVCSSGNGPVHFSAYEHMASIFGKPQNDAEPYSAIQVHRLTVVDSRPRSHSFLLPHY